MNADAVRGLLERAVGGAGSLREWARRHKLSPAYVSDVLAGRREPGPSICDAFGIEAQRKTTYRKKAKS